MLEASMKRREDSKQMEGQPLLLQELVYEGEGSRKEG